MGKWDDEAGTSLVFPRKGNVFWSVIVATSIDHLFTTGPNTTYREIREWYEVGHCYVKASTEKAILVFVSSSREEHWISRKQIVNEVSEIDSEAVRGDRGLLAITEWLATKIGF